MELNKSIILLIISFVISISAEETIDENLLFSDTTTSIDSSKLIDSTLSVRPESTTMSFSGEINSVADFGFSNKYFDNFSRKDIDPSAYIIGDLLLDVRLPMDVKAFGNVETHYLADSSKVNFNLQELFLDANIARKVYFRTGKQVLQWGRCYFWNPTDLINVESQSFEPKLGYREGAYGIKMHVPFGTRYNIYSFIDMKKMTSVDSLAGALKTEILFGQTEVGAEIWGKRDKEPVLGFDFSTIIGKFTINGEISLESGKNYTTISGLGDNEPLLDYMIKSSHSSSGYTESTIGDKPIPKICISITRPFDLFEIKDRVLVISEFYFNRAGVPGDFFNDHDVKGAMDYLATLSNSIADSSNDTLKMMQHKLQSKFANVNNFSRYYVSLFTTINKFINSNMSLQLRGIMNIEQKAALLNATLQYTTLHNLSFGLSINGAVGSKQNEYNVFGNALSTRLNVGVTF